MQWQLIFLLYKMTIPHPEIASSEAKLYDDQAVCEKEGQRQLVGQVLEPDVKQRTYACARVSFPQEPGL